MTRSKFSEDQVAYALRQAESGTAVGDVCRQVGISEATFYAWKKKYAHLGVSKLRRLRQIEEEHTRLKRRATAGASRPRQPAGLPPRRHPHPPLAHGVAHRLSGGRRADPLPPRLPAHRRPQPSPCS